MSYFLPFFIFVVGGEAHPLAPSIPLLSREETKRIDEVIDRFILYDIGKLKGADAKKAVEDFNRLGPEAIFQLIDGFNRAADMESSCPCVLIGRKISLILNSSKDVHLLAFAKENLGAGVTARRHLAVVKDLKLAAQLRRTFVVSRFGEAPPFPSTRGPLGIRSAEDLAEQIKAKGPKAKSAMEELGRRNDPKVLEILGGSDDPMAHAILQKWVAKQPAKGIGPLLNHPLAPVRLAAAQQAGKQKALGGELIKLLEDSDPAVVQAARASLVQISGGLDHGPVPMAGPQEYRKSIERWRSWWEKR